MLLKKGEPYGTVIGHDPKIKYDYEQGGKHFDPLGREVNPKTGALVDKEGDNEALALQQAEELAQAGGMEAQLRNQVASLMHTVKGLTAKMLQMEEEPEKGKKAA